MMVTRLDRLLEENDGLASLARRDFDTERIPCQMAALHSHNSGTYPYNCSSCHFGCPRHAAVQGLSGTQCGNSGLYRLRERQADSTVATFVSISKRIIPARITTSIPQTQFGILSPQDSCSATYQLDLSVDSSEPELACKGTTQSCLAPEALRIEKPVPQSEASPAATGRESRRSSGPPSYRWNQPISNCRNGRTVPCTASRRSSAPSVSSRVGACAPALSGRSA
jgi:hypothetical protein